MIIKVSSDRTADQALTPFLNVHGVGSVTQNAGVCIAVDGNSVDGISATHPAAVSQKSFAGIANTTVAINGYGLAKVWGYHASALMSNWGASVTVTAGDACIPVAGTGLGFTSFSSNTFAITATKYVTSGSTATLSAAAYVDNVIVRAL